MGQPKTPGHPRTVNVFGNLLKERRRQLQLGQKELLLQLKEKGYAAPIQTSTVSQWEKGHKFPEFDLFPGLAECLEIPFFLLWQTYAASLSEGAGLAELLDESNDHCAYHASFYTTELGAEELTYLASLQEAWGKPLLLSQIPKLLAARKK